MFRPVLGALLTMLLLADLAGLCPTTLAQEVPFVAEVVDDVVPIRAGAGRSFYIVSELSKGTRVAVDEVVFGWHKIKPPKGTYSYISQAFVEAFGDGKSGTINVSRAAVRAASINGTEESYRRQIDLLKGDTVQIVGEEGSFYKILPPDGAYLFLPPGSVQAVVVDDNPSGPTGQPEAQPMITPEITAAISTPTPTPAPAPAPNKAATPPPFKSPQTAAPKPIAQQPSPVVSEPSALPDTPKTVQPASDALKAVEHRLVEAQQIPLEQQPIQALLETYQSLRGQPGLSLVDSRIVAMRISQLNRKKAVIKTLQEVAVMRQEHEAAAKEWTDQIQPELPTEPYDWHGQLMTSAVYNGTTLPRLYRLTKADGQRITAYVRFNTPINPAPLLGQYVGIVGQIKYDPLLKLELIEADAIDVISSTATR